MDKLIQVITKHTHTYMYKYYAHKSLRKYVGSQLPYNSHLIEIIFLKATSFSQQHESPKMPRAADCILFNYTQIGAQSPRFAHSS